MTRLHALIELRDKVQAGRELDGYTASYAFPDWKPLKKWSLMDLLEWACDPSDIRAEGAAKALHEAVLPGWAWAVKTLATDACQVWLDSAYGLRRIGYIGTAKDPARAWLLAILNALIAQEQGK